MVLIVNDWGTYQLKNFKDHCVFAASTFALATMTLASHAYISCNTLLVLVFLPELEQARSSDGASCSVSSFTKDISIYAFLIFRETNSMCTHVAYFVKCCAVYRSSSFTVILYRLVNFLGWVWDTANHIKNVMLKVNTP